jgi:uncharacterized membrane protein
LKYFKFDQNPSDGEEVLKERYALLGKEMEERFRAILDSV